MFIINKYCVLQSQKMRWSGIEPEFKRWQRLVIAATLPAQSEALRHPLNISIHINSFSNLTITTLDLPVSFSNL